MNRLCALLALSALSLAGCRGDDTQPLPDAGVVRATQTAATAAAQPSASPLGARLELNNSVFLTVLSVEPTPADLAGKHPADGQDWYLLKVRVENRNKGAESQPDVTIACGNGKKSSSYGDAGPGALSRALIPPGTQEEGLLYFGKPTDCPDAIATAKATGGIVGAVKTARWKLPD